MRRHNWLWFAWSLYVLWVATASLVLADLWNKESIRPSSYLFVADPKERAFLRGLDVSGRHGQMVRIGIMAFIAVAIPGEIMVLLIRPLPKSSPVI